METLEQLKEIVKNAPDGATHYDEDGDYIKFGINYPYWYDGSTWFELESCGSVRSLSDIKLIIELMEWKEKAFEAHPNIDLDIDWI